MNMKKDKMIAFMLKQDIQIPNPIPTKSMLLEKILTVLKNIEKQYVIDSMAEKAWNQLKYQFHHLNVYTSKPSKVLDLTDKYVKKIYPLIIGIKEEENFLIMDHILDN